MSQNDQGSGFRASSTEFRGLGFGSKPGQKLRFRGQGLGFMELKIMIQCSGFRYPLLAACDTPADHTASSKFRLVQLGFT